MDINSQLYNNLNGAQIRDARELLNIILQDGVQEIKTIVDIGCGSGNVTSLMAATIPHTKIISFDIDPAMVNFSRENCKNETIEFIVQDISLPWNELDSKLQSLEGQVDLVWSNRVLHWVVEEKRPQAAANIIRLLRPQGRFYGHTTLISNFNDYLGEEERRENLKWMKISSNKEQEDGWRNFFGDGMNLVKLNYQEKEWTYANDEEWEAIKNVCRQSMSQLFLYNKKDHTGQIGDRILDFYVRSLSTPIGQPIVEKLDGSRKSYYGQFRLIAIK